MHKFSFVTEEICTYYSITPGSRQGSSAKPLSLLFLTPRRYHLTSIELWSAYFDLKTYTVITHQRIPLLLAKSAHRDIYGISGIVRIQMGIYCISGIVQVQMESLFETMV